MATALPSAEHALDPGADPAVFRAALRREKLLARAALAATARTDADRRILQALERLLADRPARCIAFCAAVRGEVDVTPSIVRLLAAGWTAAMPVVATPAAPMIFRRWTPEAPMEADRHGIPVPAADRRCEPRIVLLPLVAFDAAGYRLGYGGGYFDRTLAALSPRPLAIGVGYELSRVASVFPQAHDIRLDHIVTEAGIIDTGLG